MKINNRYIIALLRRILINFSFIIEFFFEVKNQEHHNKVIFIVGVPRSGSTVLYQTLTNDIKSLYIDNFSNSLGDKSIVSAVWASELLFRKRPHNIFKSKYGDTKEFGWNAPSEGGKYFSRFRETESWKKVNSDCKLLTSYFDMPIVFKNLYNSIYIKEISESISNVKFIHVVRNKEDNIKSILKGREEHKVENNDIWSVHPISDRKFESEEEIVDFQYEEINNLISTYLKGKPNYSKVSFEDFLNDKDNLMLRLRQFIYE